MCTLPFFLRHCGRFCSVLSLKNYFLSLSRREGTSDISTPAVSSAVILVAKDQNITRLCRLLHFEDWCGRRIPIWTLMTCLPAEVSICFALIVKVYWMLWRFQVKYTVHTRTTLPDFAKNEMSVVREHEEFIWLHSCLDENEAYAGFIVSVLWRVFSHNFVFAFNYNIALSFHCSYILKLHLQMPSILITSF